MSVFEHEHEYSKTVVFKWRYMCPQGTQTLQSCMGSLKEINACVHISYLHSPNLICLISAMPSEPSLSNNPFNIDFLLGKLLPREFSQAHQNLLQKVPREHRSRSSLRNSPQTDSRVYPHLRTLVTAQEKFLHSRILEIRLSSKE